MPTAVEMQPSNLAEEAVDHLPGLASLPEVMSQIMAMVENPRTTAGELRKAVSHDPTLVAKVLKVVNSSYFCMNARVDSLERAIVLLGINAVKNLAVAAGLGQMFRGTRLCAQFTAKDLWTHCVLVAAVARELAKRVAPKHAEEAFLAGIVHDVGILAALQLWPEKVRTVCENAAQSGQNFLLAERQVMGTDHQQLGQALAERWKFPSFCRVVAGNHHTTMTTPPASREDAALVSLVRAADVICCRSNRGFNLTAVDAGDDALTPFDPAVLKVIVENLDKTLAASASLLA